MNRGLGKLCLYVFFKIIQDSPPASPLHLERILLLGIKRFHHPIPTLFFNKLNTHLSFVAEYIFDFFRFLNRCVSPFKIKASASAYRESGSRI
jgi:hypothetical protein